MAPRRGGSRLGTRFGPYELRSLIGVGGMGEVYRAYDTTKDRMVALKLLRPDSAADPEFRERFQRESRVAARLQEPHVVPVHDFGDIDGVMYIDMRLVEGANLRDILRDNGPFELEQAISIIVQIASALDAAHSDGLVHRDVKPENVLLTADGFAYLVDFGIARASGDASVTMAGEVVGSSAYMAPERFGGDEVGPSADIYSLTCLLCECLTGQPPFETKDLKQLIGAHIFAAAPRVSMVRDDLPQALDAVIARGLAKRPEERFSSASDMAAAAEAAACAPAASSPAAVAPSLPTSQPLTQEMLAADTGAALSYSAYPEPVVLTELPGARSSLRRTQVLAAVTGLLFGTAVVLAAMLIFVHLTTPAAPPSKYAEPSANTATEDDALATPLETSTTRHVVDIDGHGFVGHAARCDTATPLVSAVETAQSLAVICQTGPDNFAYHGERLSDGATIDLVDAVRTAGGFKVTNPDDGTDYDVTPDRLTITNDGHVDSSEPVTHYLSGNAGK